MAAPLWREIILKALPHFEKKEWIKPPGIQYFKIDPETGDLSSGDGGVEIPAVSGAEPGSKQLKHALGMFGLDSESNAGESADHSETSNEGETSRNLRSLY